MTKLRKKNPFVIIFKTNLLQEKKSNMLFAGLGSVRAAEGSIFRPKVTIFHYADLPAGK